MKEQRQFARKAIHGNVCLFGQESGELIGVLVDYSDSGTMITSYQAIDTQTEFTLNMVDLPNNIGRKRSGVLKLKSIWCEQITPTMFGTGFEIIEADSHAKSMFVSYDADPNTTHL